MAIQHRRGVFNGFDPAKLVPGEWAVVLNGDPDTRDGRAVYICFAAGTVKRMATIEDANDMFENLNSELVEELSQQITEAVDKANQAASTAEEAAGSASSAAGEASSAAGEATEATETANQAAQRAEDAAKDLQEAVNKATNATDNANGAADRVDEAIAEAKGAAAQADDATESATSAATSANEAAANAQRAADSANGILEEATNAASSANQAADKANAAAKTVDDAVQSATEATEAATEATKGLDEMRERAEAAIADSLSATTDAKDATTAANEATSKAKEATSEANQATGRADEAANKADQAATDLLGKAVEGYFNGATFTPSWEGTVLHWSNDKMLENPLPLDLKGEMGQGLTVKGKCESYDQLVSDHPEPEIGDTYAIDANLWVWTGEEWTDLGNIKGADAKFGVLSADIGRKVNDPSVSVETYGDDTALNAAFHFDGLIGERGESGTAWYSGTEVSRDIASGEVSGTVDGAREGDLYFNAKNGDIFKYQAESATWTYIDTLAGAGSSGPYYLNVEDDGHLYAYYDDMFNEPQLTLGEDFHLYAYFEVEE